jgi:cytochrome P450
VGSEETRRQLEEGASELVGLRQEALAGGAGRLAACPGRARGGTVAAVGPDTLAGLPGPRLGRDEVRGLELVAHLLGTAAAHPGTVVCHAVGPFFASHMGTVGCVEVRGAAGIREVLTNASDFGTLQPDVADLPDDVRSMSRGVFTFHGPGHARHRAELRDLVVLDDRTVAALLGAVREAVGRWPGPPVDLAAACRAVARHVWSAVLFGPGERGLALGRGVGAVVDGRRARRLATTPLARRAAHRQTVHASRALARELAGWLRRPGRDGLLAGLGDGLAEGDDDEALTLAVAHATAVAAASTEPAAASLAWAVLALTQRPDLQDELRAAPPAFDGGRPRRGERDLLDRVLVESQRLLPSSALVTRATLRPVTVAGHGLPAGCEVIVSSLVAHRDPDRFPDPTRFAPERWAGLEVTPFEFFPFGAGVRGCLGATVARAMLRATLAELLATGTVHLAFDTRVGWQVPDALVPAPGVPVVLVPGDAAAGPRGRAEGPITTIVDFGRFAP